MNLLLLVAGFFSVISISGATISEELKITGEFIYELAMLSNAPNDLTGFLQQFDDALPDSEELIKFLFSEDAKSIREQYLLSASQKVE